MRVAFFGGSFDPPHLGHIAIARAAQQSLALDQVLFAPVGLQPHKPDGPTASFEDRLAMTRLAIHGEPHFELSLADAPSGSPNYTIGTLESLRFTLPPATQLYLLLGADSFRNLARWRRAPEIPFTANLVIASRPGEDITGPSIHLPEDVALSPTSNPNHFLLRNPAGHTATLDLLPNLYYEISATQLRHQIQHSSEQSTTPLIAPAVLNYIHQHHLYE
jgi:nicotinate-nucleotide adenylyltransferase